MAAKERAVAICAGNSQGGTTVGPPASQTSSSNGTQARQSTPSKGKGPAKPEPGTSHVPSAPGQYKSSTSKAGAVSSTSAPGGSATPRTTAASAAPDTSRRTVTAQSPYVSSHPVAPPNRGTAAESQPSARIAPSSPVAARNGDSQEDRDQRNTIRETHTPSCLSPDPYADLNSVQRQIMLEALRGNTETPDQGVHIVTLAQRVMNAAGVDSTVFEYVKSRALACSSFGGPTTD